MELKSVRRRYSADSILFFALNSQPHWLIFANSDNLSFAWCLTKLEKIFLEKLCTTKILQKILNPVIYFDWKNILNINKYRNFSKYNSSSLS